MGRRSSLLPGEEKDDGIGKLLSFKYRQQLFRKRKWASIMSTVVSVYGLLIAFLIAEVEIRCLEGETGSSLEHQYACSVDEIPGMESNTSHQAHQFCSGENSTVKLRVLVDGCRAYGVLDKLRWTLTASTIITLIFSIMYQYFEIRIFKFDNSLSPSVFLIQRDLYCQIAIECLVIAIHPLWLHKQVLWFMDYQYLYFMMVFRLFYAMRIALLNSHMFDSTKVQSVATLNKINIGALTKENMRLIMRTFMGDYGGRIMGLTIMINWLFVAWMIRLAEAQWNYKNGSTDGVSAFLDTLWLVPITFTTIGYGDFYPRSHIGRLWCIWLALLGCVATAILVNIMTDTLGMTRRERLLFRVLNNDNLRNSLKEKAAIVLQRTWRAHKKGKRVLAKPTIVRSNESTNKDLEDGIGQNLVNQDRAFCPVIYDAKILDAVTNFRKLRIRSMFSEDEMTDVVDMGIQQSDLHKDIKLLDIKVCNMEEKLSKIDKIEEDLGKILAVLALNNRQYRQDNDRETREKQGTNNSAYLSDESDKNN